MLKNTKNISIPSQSKSLHREFSFSLIRIVGFTALLCAAAMVGRITIPGTPVGITMQTFIVMLACLTLSIRESTSSILLYITMGALGAPVFSAGGSTLALIGPSAGFIWGFIPAALITSIIAGATWTSSAYAAANSRIATQNQIQEPQLNSAYFAQVLFILRSAAACVIGLIAVLYISGIGLESLILHTDPLTIALASTGYIATDMLKVLAASILASLFIRRN